MCMVEWWLGEVGLNFINGMGCILGFGCYID